MEAWNVSEAIAPDKWESIVRQTYALLFPWNAWGKNLCVTHSLNESNVWLEKSVPLFWDLFIPEEKPFSSVVYNL